jgi:hypothetical protein
MMVTNGDGLSGGAHHKVVILKTFFVEIITQYIKVPLTGGLYNLEMGFTAR